MSKTKGIVITLLHENNRLYVHILFWLVYYLYRVQIYIDIYPYTPIVQFLEILNILPVVYLNLYFLLPKFLKKRKVLEYGVMLLFSILATSVIRTETVRFMMSIDIYAPNYQALYSTWKFTTITSRIVTMVFATSTIKILKDTYISQQINHKLEQDKLENELKYLKTQVNPHFFFNTVNNLYALVQQKSDNAPDMVLKLSDIMHYMLYETNQNLVSLPKEIETLNSYIELEKLRFGDELNIMLESKGTFEKQEIAPMLLIPIIENCFKHGFDSVSPSNWIKMELKMEKDIFHFKVENSVNTEDESSSEGIGLTNIQRRLELIYKDHFVFKTEQLADSFTTLLSIDLSMALYAQKP